VAWDAFRNALLMAANNQAPTSAGGIGDTGGYIPHVVLFAMAAAESNWQQFDKNQACNLNPPAPYVGGTNPPGWGALQITFNRVDSDRYLLYNVSHGAKVLNDGWNNPFGWPATGPNGAVVNSASRNEIEDWFFAIWNYNGAGCRQLNPDANNPRFNALSHYMSWSPSLGTRAGYTYEDVVYYFMQHPPADTWSAAAPGGSYYPTLYLGYPGDGGRGYPAYTSFPSNTTACPTGYHVTTTGLDYGYNYAFITNSWPSPESRNAAYSAYVQVRNTGNNIWYPSGAAGMRLGTTQLKQNGAVIGGQDHASPFAYSNWILTSRPAAVQADILPDAAGLGSSVAQFNFTMCPNCVVGASPSTYDEYFNLVVDGTMWLPDLGIWAHIVVQ
jgi:hypothetical protein